MILIESGPNRPKYESLLTHIVFLMAEKYMVSNFSSVDLYLWINDIDLFIVILKLIIFLWNKCINLVVKIYTNKKNLYNKQFI